MATPSPPTRAICLENSVCLALARDGRHTLHIGPVMARDEASVVALVAATPSSATQPISIDVPAQYTEFKALLANIGFALLWKFTHMHTAIADFGNPQRCFAVASSEFR